MAMLAAIAMIAAQVAGRASRDALFLSYYEPSQLPKVMMAAALVSIASTFTLSSWLARSSPARVIPMVFAASGALMIGQWALIEFIPRIGAVAIYLQIAAFGALLISGFWSVVNERFDPHTAKRIVPRIAAMAALGGIVGGVAAERAAATFGLSSTMLMLGALYMTCAVCVSRIGDSEQAASTPAEGEASVASGLSMLRASPFLRQMAGVVAACALLDSLLDYALKAEAARTLTDGESLIQFFALFYTAVGFVTFLLQVSLGQQVLRRFGIGGAMIVYPAAVLLGGAGAAALTKLWTIALVRASGAVATNSLFRAGFELLYTPVPAATKRPAKIFVDVGSQRVGDIAGSGLIMLLLLLPSLPMAGIMALSAVVAAGLLWAIRKLQQGYVDQLARSLRKGIVALDEAEVVDATTARTLAASQMALDRHSLLTQIEEHRREREGAGAERAEHGTPTEDLSSSRPGAEQPAELPLTPADEATLARVQALYSSERQAILRVLDERPGDPRVAAHAIRLLEVPSLVEPSMKFLRRVAPSAVGLLVDCLLDPILPIAIQRRIGRVLEASEDPRALDGLDRALGSGPLPSAAPDADELFELRCQLAQSAARMIGRNPDLALPASRINELVLRELSVDEETWNRQGQRDARVRDRSALLDGSALQRIPRNVEHQFTLLSLGLDREVMASTLAGLYSENAQMRGTALEYLEVALPAELQEALIPRLETLREARTPAERAAAREAGAIADELLRSSASIVIERKHLDRS